ncbi:YczI family protein [Niallia sp. XMNu-256]|uniref:YczI family protein n=1 Tax=Niallia sp. XMNu-256 TaxID=3082444 RepID=UPI0030D44D6E
MVRKEVTFLLKNLRYVLSVITFLFASYGLITGDFKYGGIMIFFLGLTMLVMGLEEIRNERKVVGWLLIIVFLFSIYVSIEGFLLS